MFSVVILGCDSCVPKMRPECLPPKLGAKKWKKETEVIFTHKIACISPIILWPLKTPFKPEDLDQADQKWHFGHFLCIELVKCKISLHWTMKASTYITWTYLIVQLNFSWTSRVSLNELNHNCCKFFTSQSVSKFPKYNLQHFNWTKSICH